MIYHGSEQSVQETTIFEEIENTAFGSEHYSALGWLVGALPPHPRTVDLKVSEMSAFGPPRGCASGSLWVNIIIS